MVKLVRERGGSLLVLAGSKYTPKSYVGTPVGDIMPVRITREYLPVREGIHPVPTEYGNRTFAMLEPPEDVNAEVWQLVRPLYAVPSLEGARPAANVLVELPATLARPKPYPLIAWHYVGTGKVMYVGTDQLWRLRFMRGDYYHARFWGAGHTVPRPVQAARREQAYPPSRRTQTELRAGQRVEIFANVLDESFQPSKASDYIVRIDRMVSDRDRPEGTNDPGALVADTARVKLAPMPDTPGLYHGFQTLKHQGLYTVRARDEDLKAANSVDIVVAPSDREKEEPAMQGTMLRKMASLSGGRYLTVRDWPGLAGMIEGRERTVVERKDVDLWDIWPAYVLFVVCVGLEWFLRRRWHLV